MPSSSVSCCSAQARLDLLIERPQPRARRRREVRDVSGSEASGRDGQCGVVSEPRLAHRRERDRLGQRPLHPGCQGHDRGRQLGVPGQQGRGLGRVRDSVGRDRLEWPRRRGLQVGRSETHAGERLDQNGPEGEQVIAGEREQESLEPARHPLQLRLVGFEQLHLAHQLPALGQGDDDHPVDVPEQAGSLAVLAQPRQRSQHLRARALEPVVLERRRRCIARRRGAPRRRRAAGFRSRARSRRPTRPDRRRRPAPR